MQYREFRTKEIVDLEGWCGQRIRGFFTTMRYTDRLTYLLTYQERIQKFWKRGPGKGVKPRTERRRGAWGPPPENFGKLDAISCNLAYIFWIRMASDIIQNWAFAEQKTVAATISKPTDIR